MRPSSRVKELADRLGVELNEFGFCQTDRLAPMAASKPGIYVAGRVPGAQGHSRIGGPGLGRGGLCAWSSWPASRGTMIQRHEYPWERDVTDETPRIGVFICHCGHNIASVVDVKEVAARAAPAARRRHAEANLYTCSDTSQQHIKDMIAQASAQPPGGGVLLAAHARGAVPGDPARVRA